MQLIISDAIITHGGWSRFANLVWIIKNVLDLFREGFLKLQHSSPLELNICCVFSWLPHWDTLSKDKFVFHVLCTFHLCMRVQSRDSPTDAFSKSLLYVWFTQIFLGHNQYLSRSSSCQVLSAGNYEGEGRNPTGLVRVSEAGRFDGAYEIVCIKHTGQIVDYEHWE